MTCRILLVDDNPIVLEALGLLLRRHGFDVVTEGDPRTAAEIMQVRAFDAVVSDFRMPGHDGRWVLQQAARLLPNAYKVLASGDQTATAAELEAHPEVDRFLRKPVEKSLLLSVLRTAHQRAAM